MAQPQEGSKSGGNANDNEGKRKVTRGTPQGNKCQRSGSAGAEPSKVSKMDESPAMAQSKSNKSWPWDIEQRSQEGSAEVLKPKMESPWAVEEESDEDSQPDSEGSDGGNGEANLLENRLVMKWIDENHVVNEGAVRIPPRIHNRAKFTKG